MEIDGAILDAEKIDKIGQGGNRYEDIVKEIFQKCAEKKDKEIDLPDSLMVLQENYDKVPASFTGKVSLSQTFSAIGFFLTSADNTAIYYKDLHQGFWNFQIDFTTRKAELSYDGE